MDICFLNILRNKWAYLVGEQRLKQMFTGKAAKKLVFFPPISCFIWASRSRLNIFDEALMFLSEQANPITIQGIHSV